MVWVFGLVVSLFYFGKYILMSRILLSTSRLRVFSFHHFDRPFSFTCASPLSQLLSSSVSVLTSVLAFSSILCSLVLCGINGPLLLAYPKGFVPRHFLVCSLFMHSYIYLGVSLLAAFSFTTLFMH